MHIRILFIDSVHPLLHHELEKAGFTCELAFELSNEEIGRRIAGYDGIVIRSRIKLDAELIDKAAGRLKFIARVGAGMENIDVKYAESKGIQCLHAPEGNRDAVAEHALGMLLALFNNLCRANQQVRKGQWIREGNRGNELMGKTVGIIGYGNMGSAFAERLQGFGVKVMAYDKYKSHYTDPGSFVIEATLEQLFEEVDVLSLHLPLTEETRFMIDDKFIKKIKKNFYLINTARGKIVKTDDLISNLISGKILGACLDVLEYEVLSFENIDHTMLPAAFQYLVKSDQVILSPHIAGWTYESNEKMARILVEKIKRLFPD